MSETPLSKLAQHLGARLVGDGRILIRGVAPIESAGPDQLTFLANLAYAPRLKNCAAGAVLVAESFDGEVPMAALRTENPRLAFGRAISFFHPRRRPAPGIHATASVAPTARVAASAHVGAHAVVGEHSVIGEGTVLHPHCVIYDDVVIGEQCTLHSHVSIREGTRMGNRVEIHNGTVIGADGFGFEPDANGRLHKIPQAGIVRIEDDVEIQANSCVDRASLGETVVKRGAKLDNFVQVGHSCTVGEDNILCSQVGMAGSSHLGRHVTLGGQVGLAGHLRIGDGVQVAAQAGIPGDLAPGTAWGGSPAHEINLWKRQYVAMARLPEALRTLKALVRQVEALEKRRAPPSTGA